MGSKHSLEKNRLRYRAGEEKRNLENFAVNRVAKSEGLLSLSVRSDGDLLMRIIALQRVLQRVEEPVNIRPRSLPFLDSGAPNLRDRLIAGPWG